MSAEILSQIEDVLDQIRPALHADGGDVEVVDYDEEGFVYLNMQGSCGGCPMSTMTLMLCERAAAIIVTWACQGMLRTPLRGVNAQSKIGRCSGFRSAAPSIVSSLLM